MSTFEILQLILASSGPILAALAHYRLNQGSAHPPATPAPSAPESSPAKPQLGDGHILMAVLNLLSNLIPQNQSAPTPAPVPAPAPSDTTSQLLALLSEAQSVLAQLAKNGAGQSVTPVAPTSPAPSK